MTCDLFCCSEFLFGSTLSVTLCYHSSASYATELQFSTRMVVRPFFCRCRAGKNCCCKALSLHYCTHSFQEKEKTSLNTNLLQGSVSTSLYTPFSKKRKKQV